LSEGPFKAMRIAQSVRRLGLHVSSLSTMGSMHSKEILNYQSQYQPIFVADRDRSGLSMATFAKGIGFRVFLPETPFDDADDELCDSMLTTIFSKYNSILK
jgi:hypothetical protein